jgi:hypothetical protein
VAGFYDAGNCSTFTLTSGSSSNALGEYDFQAYFTSGGTLVNQIALLNDNCGTIGSYDTH